ncbi:hypothetical protein [Streptomyces sp. NPDC047065]|uniref:hypothetical protein n=1 Tax=Streptomyces sp. NPDC047065 TaxID=3154606 RepID=UPI0033CBCBAC
MTNNQASGEAQSAPRFALILRPSATFEITAFAGDSPTDLANLYAWIGSPNITVHDLSSKVSVWGIDASETHGVDNKAAVSIYAAIASDTREFHGTVVFTGIDERGRTTGLTLNHCAEILEIVGIHLKSTGCPRG